ncbi:phage holin family protein, partial [Acinetobacter baumannii]|uniref:phage holin family protein n=1 Tax=Acinetobacter baumannii TaxID=470 RepID=UPI00332D1680
MPKQRGQSGLIVESRPLMNDPSSLPSLSTGELVSQLSEQASRLIRDEIQLAQIEMSTKAKKAGLGAGL